MVVAVAVVVVDGGGGGGASTLRARKSWSRSALVHTDKTGIAGASQ